VGGTRGATLVSSNTTIITIKVAVKDGRGVDLVRSHTHFVDKDVDANRVIEELLMQSALKMDRIKAFGLPENLNITDRIDE
jgi:hypothetical protein